MSAISAWRERCVSALYGTIMTNIKDFRAGYTYALTLRRQGQIVGHEGPYICTDRSCANVKEKFKRSITYAYIFSDGPDSVVVCEHKAGAPGMSSIIVDLIVDSEARP